MDKRIEKSLIDIIGAIRDIESFVERFGKEYRIYNSDIAYQSCVERKIETIGEATGRILKVDNTLPISSARRIVDTRNRISHGYDSVSNDMIWTIVINHLPKLKAEVEELLKQD